MIVVCYNGLEKKCNSIIAAELFGKSLRALLVGYDIWNSDILVQSHIYNVFTGKFEDCEAM